MWHLPAGPPNSVGLRVPPWPPGHSTLNNSSLPGPHSRSIALRYRLGARAVPIVLNRWPVDKQGGKFSFRSRVLCPPVSLMLLDRFIVVRLVPARRRVGMVGVLLLKAVFVCLRVPIIAVLLTFLIFSSFLVEGVVPCPLPLGTGGTQVPPT